MMNALRHYIQQKIDRYNKAKDGIRMGQATAYLNELKGMQQVLEVIGIHLELETNPDYTLGFTLE
jgi:hypothetical protein